MRLLAVISVNHSELYLRRTVEKISQKHHRICHVFLFCLSLNKEPPLYTTVILKHPCEHYVLNMHGAKEVKKSYFKIAKPESKWHLGSWVLKLGLWLNWTTIKVKSFISLIIVENLALLNVSQKKGWIAIDVCVFCFSIVQWIVCWGENVYKYISQLRMDPALFLAIGK